MKCQKCGRNEVNFHYSSEQNGHVTQMHLCSQCAAESGYNLEQMFSNMFTGIHPMRSLNRQIPSLIPAAFFMPGVIPMLQAGNGFPFDVQIQPKTTCGCGCSTHAPDTKNVEVDEKLKQRRELNMQMRIAAQNEEFEKAAEIRDKLKELDAE